jgi:hypothetical protein
VAAALLMGVLAGSWFTAALMQPLPQAEPTREAAPAGVSARRPVVSPEPPAVLEPAPELETSRPRAGAPEQPQATGAVTIGTPGGWAVVFAGKKRLGVAPGRFVLPSGRHVLRIWPAGNSKRQITRMVRIAPSTRVQLRVPLKR